MRARRSVAERFWEKVDKSAWPKGCWLWKACVDDNGYGRFTMHDANGRKRAHWAHRVAYELAVGPIGSGMLVCHTCDNPICMNPDHLWIGTYQENSDDMDKKGRRVVGEDRPQAKLNDEAVRAIRGAPSTRGTQARLVKIYGVASSVISRIRTGKIWRHVL